jgi:hypothetical protein
MSSTATLPERRRWWLGLESQWKMAFQMVVLNHDNMPNDEELDKLMQTKVLRLAGPTAPYPNIN